MTVVMLKQWDKPLYEALNAIAEHERQSVADLAFMVDMRLFVARHKRRSRPLTLAEEDEDLVAALRQLVASYAAQAGEKVH